MPNTTTTAAKVYLIHFRREWWNTCPLCGASVTWRRVGVKRYSPCDEQPVLCTWDPDSPLRVVWRGDLRTGVRILTPENAAAFVGLPNFYAYQPHVFTCPKLHRLTAFRAYQPYREKGVK